MDPFYQNPNGPNATEITNWKPETIPINTLNYVVSNGEIARGGTKRVRKSSKKTKKLNTKKPKTKKTKRSLKQFLKKRGKILKNNFSMKVCLKYP